MNGSPQPLPGPPGSAGQAELERLRARYWRHTSLITAALLCAWFAVTLGSAYFADLLNRFEFLGFPLGFYLSAQGNLLAYLAIVAFYARFMNRLDRRFAEDSRPCTGD